MKKKSRIALIVSASILGFILLFLMCAFLLFSYIFYVTNKIEDMIDKVFLSDNFNFAAEEIDFSFGKNINGVDKNARFVYDGIEYSAVVRYNVHYASFRAEIFGENDEIIGVIRMIRADMPDENTFILEVKESDFDIPKMLTFHRITQN